MKSSQNAIEQIKRTKLKNRWIFTVSKIGMRLLKTGRGHIVAPCNAGWIIDLFYQRKTIYIVVVLRAAQPWLQPFALFAAARTGARR